MRHGQVDSLEVLRIVATWSGTQLVVRLSGELDLGSAVQLRSALDGAADQHPSAVILDLECVSFMDAAGIRAILTGAETFGPRFVLRSTPLYVKRLFAIIGLEQELNFESDSSGV